MSLTQWICKKPVDYTDVASVLDLSVKTNQLTNGGPVVAELESYLRASLQVQDDKAVIVVANGSVALHALSSGIAYTEQMESLRWATQAFTFPPSAQSNLSNTAILDIDLDQGALDLEQVDPNIQGLIVTNIFGNVVDIERYVEWTRNGRGQRFLIFDNAATALTFYRGKNCLNYGDGCAISFHHTKPFGFGEGGAIIADKKYEHAIRCLNNFGIGLCPDAYWSREGNNNKMSDVSAAFIYSYLRGHLSTIVTRHQDLYRSFKAAIQKRPLRNFRLFPSFHDDKDDKIVVSCFAIICRRASDTLVREINRHGINCRRYYHPLAPLPNAQWLHDHIICLPCHSDMTDKDVDHLVDVLRMLDDE